MCCVGFLILIVQMLSKLLVFSACELAAFNAAISLLEMKGRIEVLLLAPKQFFDNLMK